MPTQQQVAVAEALGKLGITVGGLSFPDGLPRFLITPETVSAFESLLGMSFVIVPDGQLLSRQEAARWEAITQAKTAVDD